VAENIIRVGVVCVLRCDQYHLFLDVADPGSGGHFLIPPGGEVRFDELAKDAVVRAVEEDIGVEVNEPTQLGVLESRIIFNGELQHEVMFCFGSDIDIETKGGITAASLRTRGRTAGLRWLNLSEVKRFDEAIVPAGLADLILTPINDPKVPVSREVIDRKEGRD